MDLSIIIPFQTDHGPREKAFQWVLRYYETVCPTAEICIGDVALPFNKAKAVNEAVTKAKGSILAIIDADIICDPNLLNHCHQLLKLGPWIIPFREVLDLSKESTNRLLNENPNWPIPSIIECNKRIIRNHQLPVGGINVMKKESFEAVGGLDERFLGWGGEDDAFVASMNTFCGHYVRMNHRIYHLWHPPSQPKENPHYKDNFQLALRYCRAQGNVQKMKRIIEERKKDF